MRSGTDTGLKSTKVDRATRSCFTFAGQARLPGVRLLPLQRRDRAAARVQELQQHRPHDRQPDRAEIVGTGPYLYQSGVGAQSQTVVWKQNEQLVGDQGARPQRRRRPTSSTSRTARTRPRSPTSLAGNIDLFNNFAPKAAIKGNVKTYFSSVAVPPRREHRRGSSRTRRRSRSTTRQFRRALAYSINMQQILDKAYQGLVDEGEPDRPAADLEQVGQQEGRQASTASPTTSRRRSRSSPPPATRTRTATATSRTRTARRSTSASSARTAGRTG